MWIVVTFLATIFQTLRTAVQARLRADLSVNAASYVRYILGAPLSITACILAVWWSADGMPTIPLRFWLIVTAAGIAQIVGTIALLTAFDRSDFAIGTVYSKTEVIQVAMFSAVIVGEPLRFWGWLSVIVVLVGVVKLAGRLTRRFVSSLPIVIALLKQAFLPVPDLRLRQLASGGRRQVSVNTLRWFVGSSLLRR